MAKDVHHTISRKEEFRSERMANFQFRQRARALRLLAERLGMDHGPLVEQVALQPDDAKSEDLAQSIGRALDELIHLHRACWHDAHDQLLIEIGDPLADGQN